MGQRELKRVPLEFNYPLKKVWGGYLNPYRGEDCDRCGGSGNSEEYDDLMDLWYGRNEVEWVWIVPGRSRYNKLALQYNINEEDIANLIAEDRLISFTRRPRTPEQVNLLEESGEYYLEESNGYIPSPEEVNEWAKTGMGHDSINGHIVISARLKKEGKPFDCAVCKGKGVFYAPGIEELHNAWQPFEPPTGEGWQLWENCSEGSPITLVFKTAEELAKYAAENSTICGREKLTEMEWLEMFLKDSVSIDSFIVRSFKDEI